MRRIKVAMVQEDTSSLMLVKEEQMEGTTAVSLVLKRQEKENGVEADAVVMGEIDSYILEALARLMADTAKSIADGRKENAIIKAIFINAFLKEWQE